MAPGGSAGGEPPLLRNPFHDPFLQATAGMPGCPVPEPPLYSEQEVKELAHQRAQRGVSCWLSGRCRLPNAYQYDAEIVPRVRQAILADGRFEDTSVWVLGQRRLVWLQGCVRVGEQAQALAALVRDIDDVEGVNPELMVGTAGPVPYRTASADRTEAGPGQQGGARPAGH